MAYLRCTACGAKALSAATQCPRCTTPFALTDAEGRRVRLTPCRGCGYLHRVDVACHWCGVLPPSAWRRPARWHRVAVAMLSLVVAGGAWRVGAREGAAPVVAPRPEAGEAAASGGNTPTVQAGGAAAFTPATLGADSVDAPLPGPVPLPLPAPVTGEARVGGDSLPWVPAVARTWVNVRRNAARDGEVVGVISPDSRAMLGTHQSGWRRVRSADVNGWVDPRLFVADSSGRRGE